MSEEKTELLAIQLQHIAAHFRGNVIGLDVEVAAQRLEDAASCLLSLKRDLHWRKDRPELREKLLEASLQGLLASGWGVARHVDNIAQQAVLIADATFVAYMAAEPPQGEVK